MKGPRMKIEMERRATHDETAAEMDRRGVVSENLEAEIERLRGALKKIGDTENNVARSSIREYAAEVLAKAV